MKVIVVIPARFESSRFPGKPLAKIHGKELILRVIEKCEKVVNKKNIYVATDSLKIKNFILKNNYNCCMTGKKNLTGTDRVAEIAKKIKSDIYINVQGDEPLVSPNSIKKIINSKIKNFNKVICGYTKIKNFENKQNPNIPKVVFNSNEELLYISRSAIPGSKEKFSSHTYFKQVCIYAYNKDELTTFKNCKKKSYLEDIEDIELLRFFELGKKIKMEKTVASSVAVDVPSDIKLVERILKKLR